MPENKRLNVAVSFMKLPPIDHETMIGRTHNSAHQLVYTFPLTKDYSTVLPGRHQRTRVSYAQLVDGGMGKSPTGPAALVSPFGEL